VFWIGLGCCVLGGGEGQWGGLKGRDRVGRGTGSAVSEFINPDPCSGHFAWTCQQLTEGQEGRRAVEELHGWCCWVLVAVCAKGGKGCVWLFRGTGRQGMTCCC
jgi:hypothetical protein